MVLKHSSPGMRECGAPYQTAVVNQHAVGREGQMEKQATGTDKEGGRGGGGEEREKGRSVRCVKERRLTVDGDGGCRSRQGSVWSVSQSVSQRGCRLRYLYLVTG